MISYAARRIVRGRGLFLALFMSVVLAATLFSGILQGADAVGVSLLDSTLRAANVDVTCTAAEKNVTVTRVYEADKLFGKIDGVKKVDHLIRMKIDLNSSASNGTITSILLVLPDDSDLLKEASGAIILENGKIHIETASTNATMFPEGETATVSFETYKPYGDLMDFKKLYFNFQVAEPVAFKAAVEALSQNVQKVDITSLYSEKTINNIFLAGPRRVEELGIYFSSLVASVGVLLVVSTILRSRWKELTLMTVRGFSSRQLEASLLLENVGMSLFAATLGVAIGFVALKVEAQVFNMVVPTMLQRQVVFPMASTINLLLVIALLLAATVAPILVSVRRITDKPSWKTEE